jgi:hypothetical protein
LTDVDALTVSISRTSLDGNLQVAAQALAIGMLSNTALKLTLVTLIGRGPFRGLSALGLAAMAAAAAASLAIL